MAYYFMRRVFKGLLTVFISVTITFFILRLMPSDPITIMVDPKMSEEVKANMLAQYGLDKPIGTQYVIFIKELLKGNLGISFKHHLPVSELISQRMPWTLLLLGIVLPTSLLVGIPIGVLAAKYKNSFFDQATNVVIMVGISVFLPFLAFAFLVIFSSWLKIFPTGGAYTPPPAEGMEFYIDVARHAFLPSLTLFIGNVATIILYTRNSMLDVMKEDYIRTAYSKGWNGNYVIRVHALKNALIPTITVTGMMLASMVGGAVMTETIYAWPGVGRLIFESVQAMDFPVLQGAFLVLAVTVVVMNILTDLVVAWLDPRIKLEG
jgi:peptide/nickel transport system permease protein